MRLSIVLVAMLCLFFNNSLLYSQLDNPDWGEDLNGISYDRCDSDPSALLYPGVAVITCGVTVDVPVAERYVMAYAALNESIPNGQGEITNMDSVLHHSSWLVQNMGNVFGVALKESTATPYVLASSNYSSNFGAINTVDAVLNYGTIGAPAHDTIASGTIYEIDPITGEATVFAVLPQRLTTLEHWSCEEDVQEVDRTNTGVGLGNIAYDVINDQFFVTNPEDGRIYRLSSTGVILDSFDPFNLDSGLPGVDILAEVPYGIAVEPGSERLFFGMVDPGQITQTPNTQSTRALPGAPEIYSIDLTATGGFSGTIDNSVNQSGLTFDNYVGTETLHGNIPTSEPAGVSSYTYHTTYFISDLAFTPSGDLLVGVRVGCYGSWHSSYNHWGETDLISINMSTSLYSNTPFQYDLTAIGDAGDEDAYGGVAVYDLHNGTCDVKYVSSAADMVDEEGPHGIAIWESDNNTPMNAMGMFSYGVIDNSGGNNLDPKGAGGDIEIYGGCQSCNISGPNAVCVGSQVTLSVVQNCAGMEFKWTVNNGATIDGPDSLNTVTITPGSSDFVATITSGQISQVCSHSLTLVDVMSSSSATGVTCYNGSNGTGTITPSGGITPYTYLWNNGQTTATATGLTAGNYNVIVTDSAGCSSIESIVVDNTTLPCYIIGIVRN